MRLTDWRFRMTDWCVPGGALFVAVLAHVNPSALAAQQHQPRMVIGSNVACRTRPEVSAPVVRRYEFGQSIPSSKQVVARSGIWYWDESRFPSPRGCWIYGPLTTAWSNREAALIAATDRILGRGDSVSFEEYVAADNLLSQMRLRPHSDSTVLQSSPLLQLRRLQILERAARVADARDARRNPLVHAWFIAHEDELAYHEPYGGWMLTADVYWRLFAEHRHTQWAEEIAWAAAQGDVPGDECYAACWLDRLNRTYARYWTEFPRGRWVAEALAHAHRHFDYGLQAGCHYAPAGEPTNLARRLRESLASVVASNTDQLLAKIREIERMCEAART